MGSNTYHIAIDVMGADLGIREMILGVKLALEELGDQLAVTLVGDQAQIQELLKECGLSGYSRLSIQHASQVIEMDEKPTQSLKKKDSSIVKALELLKEKKVDAMVSCGNTGSLVAGGTIKLRPMPGLERPALSSIIPSKDRHFILVDAGANPDPDPIQLVHNAILGSNHCRVALGIDRPTVGLLTIGTEEGKGTERIQETHQLLKKIDGLISYTGLIEGFHVFDRDVDVVVCDGFVGNILVKTCEGLFHTLKRLFIKELTKNPWRKIGAFLSMGAFKAIKSQFNPDRYGAAPLLGINGTVLKSHGSSNRNALMNAIKAAVRIVSHDMNDQIQKDVEEADRLIKQNAEVSVSG